MTKRSAQYQAKRAEIVAKMGAVHEAAGDNPLSAEQQTEWATLEAKLVEIDAQIARADKLAEAERAAPAVPVDQPHISVTPRAERDPRWGFNTSREFLLSVIENRKQRAVENVSDERLRPLAVRGDDAEIAYMLPRGFTPQGLMAAAGSDEQQTASFQYGGALIQPTFIPQMLQLGFEGDPTAGRTTRVPMSSPSISIPARTDKTHTSSVSGGLTVARRDETAAAASSLMSMERVSLVAKSLFGLSYATEEILEDSPISFAAILAAGFQDEFASKILKEKLHGLGGDQYQGVVTADCTVTQTRTTASTFKGRDAANMVSRCWGSQNAIWLINHDVRPQLAQLHIPVPSEATPTNIVSVFQPSLVPGQPDMLMGLPVYYSEFCRTLGTSGDVILANFTQYLEGLYTPLRSAESIHVRFANHERTFKFWVRNCGAPWWRSALTPAYSTTTLSPFVILS